MNTIAAFSALLVSIMTIATVIYSSATRTAKLEVKVDTMWAFQMRRAVSEAVSSDLADLNSPLAFHPDTLRVLDPLRDRLQTFVREHRSLKTLDLLFALEQQFGADLLVDFCIPLGTYQGACLLAALQVGFDKPIEVTNDQEVISIK